MTKSVKKKISFAVIDDHPFIRDALIKMISDMHSDKNEEFDVLIEAEDGKDFISKLSHHKQKVPDVVILDIKMPRMNGFDTMRWIALNHPQIKVLAYSMSADPVHVATMIKEGAAGYITKSAKTGEMQNAIHSVVKNGYYHERYITLSLITALKNTNFDETFSLPNFLNDKNLTEKEMMVLNELATDLTYSEIASKLGLSTKTIDRHRENLFKKLDVKSRVSAVLYGIKHNIIRIAN